MGSVRIAPAARPRVLHRTVLDVIYLVGVIALFALVGLIARAVEKL